MLPKKYNINVIIEECIKYHRNTEIKVTMPGEKLHQDNEWYLY